MLVMLVMLLMYLMLAYDVNDVGDVANVDAVVPDFAAVLLLKLVSVTLAQLGGGSTDHSFANNLTLTRKFTYCTKKFNYIYLAKTFVALPTEILQLRPCTGW